MQLTVSAAASLTDAFTDIEQAFEAAHPGVNVVMNFASSGALYRQIEQGAPVDVYASANPKWMDRAEAAGFVLAGSRVAFAGNDLVLVVPRGNRAKVHFLGGLTGPLVTTVAVGTPETVPAGQYAKNALAAAGLWETLHPRLIFCESVRQVLDYLRRGEVDAGFVYRTDAVKAGDLVQVVADVQLDTPVTYPMAVLRQASETELARAFVGFVTGPQGQELLQKRGFGPRE
ncbi:MAG: molybdate ABC transporter substrate-binding protein [Desulfohalobiaceae bacterium]